MLHCFWGIAIYWSKIAVLAHVPHLYLALQFVSYRIMITLEFRRDFWPQKTRVPGRCLCDSRFRTPTCDRRTDRQTHDDSIYRASIASRGNERCCTERQIYSILLRISSEVWNSLLVTSLRIRTVKWPNGIFFVTCFCHSCFSYLLLIRLTDVTVAMVTHEA